MLQNEDSLANTFVYHKSDSEDSRVIEISREYLALLEAGKTPDKAKFISRYPELSEIVEECLEGIDLAHSLSQHLSPQLSEMMAKPLGDFKIVREVGRGGMATVYEATQLSLGRRVALKVLPFAAALDECQRQRFQIESHAAANLHHTNIVPVYAVGSERGMHYYAMQLIEGESLSEWVIRQKQELTGEHAAHQRPEEAAGSDTGTQTDSTEIVNPSVSHTDHRAARSWYQTIAKIIAQIAEALDYAHSSGVIHRDIKPANLLIDIKGNAWITDFGLAQVSASSSVTRTGDLLGTLRYMSPEQLSGKRALIDQRTDIYSLGATLYELLCLQPVFSASARQQLLHDILYDEPKPLRQVNRSIPIELETIVMKSLSKLPAERYQTAAELADDLHRFLDERPILARRPTLVDHTRKWLRRHPSVVVSSFIVLLLGLVGVSFAMAAISQEEHNTRQALTREQQRAQEAEQRLQLAQRAADDMIALAEFELSDNPFDESLRKKLLESALAHYQAMMKEQQDNPAALEKLKETRDRIEQILTELIVLQSDRETHILRQPDVLNDLKVTEEQKSKITELFDWRQSQIRQAVESIRGQPKSQNERKSQTIRKRMIQDAKDTTAAINQILTRKQLERLKQLTLQIQGSRALHETEVINILNLTNEQRLAMRAIESEYQFRRRPPRAGQRSGPAGKRSFSGENPPQSEQPEEKRIDGSQYRPPGGRARENDSDQLKQILSLLTPQQLQQWNEMTGAPFSGDIDDARRPLGPK
ncbi:Serine/threonine-protein kinase PrkC [Gimesia alba]|uniref:non-specific serine/threonine protein kinase n=1 Tax=Gimesia alba TaxID=2527973 RepID=A0A517RD00_9PLAN|nr:serine/threonine-protein kinase [Gimesia alba]QDT41726.1 Serine/threonine-protein kinase PrkC [Gimesia alba]